MKRILAVFLLNSVFIFAKQDLKFKIIEKNNENIKILITKDSLQTSKPKEIKRKIYVVKSGDTLFLIAQKFNLSTDFLIKINNLKDKNLIRVNQKIIIQK